VWRYVLIYVPGAAALLGIAVALRRRSTEGRAWRGDDGGAKKKAKDDPGEGGTS
jgi:hypothetical protein